MSRIFEVQMLYGKRASEQQVIEDFEIDGRKARRVFLSSGRKIRENCPFYEAAMLRSGSGSPAGHDVLAELEAALLDNDGPVVFDRTCDLLADSFDIALFKQVLQLLESHPPKATIFESNWQTVAGNSRLPLLKQLTFPASIQIRTSSMDKDVRELCENEFYDNRDIKAAIESCRSDGVSLRITCVHGVPFLDSGQQATVLLNTVRGLKSLLTSDDDVTLAIEPETLPQYTLLQALHDKGEYQIPTADDVREITRQVDSAILIDDPHHSAFPSYTLEDIHAGISAAASALSTRGVSGPRTFWIGLKESDLDTVESKFAGSMTNFGSGTRGNSSLCSYIGRRVPTGKHVPERWAYYSGLAEQALNEDGSSRFMFYSEAYSYLMSEKAREAVVCANDSERHFMLHDKGNFRALAENVIPVPKCATVKVSEYCRQWIEGRFGNADKIVVQRERSASGKGTFFLSPDDPLPGSFDDPEEEVLVSQYYENRISVNAHVFVYEDEILVMPGSVQIILSGTRYFGGDYAAFQDLSEPMQSKFYAHCRRIGEAVRETGFRGLFGLDGVVAGDDYVFIEINARFQGSTQVLNRMLSEAGLPSCQDLHHDAFFFRKPAVTHDEIVSKCNFKASITGNNDTGVPGNWEMVNWVKEAAKGYDGALVFDDGETLSECDADDAYLFNVIFDGRICEVHDDFDMVPYWNLCYEHVPCHTACLIDMDEDERDRLREELSRHGCQVTGDADAPGTLIISASGSNFEAEIRTDLPYQEFSPFGLKIQDGGHGLLLFLGRAIATVNIIPAV